ncbi:MAG: Flp family type IVb pilin [Actinomycetales bacterium]
MTSHNRRWQQTVKRDECGATAAEYAILVSLISVFIAGTVFTFGQVVVGLFAGLAPTL